MKKTKRIICILAAMLLPVLAAAGCGEREPADAPAHTHTFVWKRSETLHWLECTDPACGLQSDHGEHEGGVCEVCAAFRALSFGFTEGSDAAHADFAREANEWFSAKGAELGFTYDFMGNDYAALNDETLKNYDIVLFLNDRPHVKEQQEAFERFMEGGGAWIGFHSAAFSMVEEADKDKADSDYWRWYQDEFLGCGNYKNNTWNPTAEPLTVETHDHPATANLPDVFTSAPCEWYGWEYDLFQNPDITVLLTLNPTQENPAGDNPNKEWEIWYDGHYPIAWANNRYNMIYTNMGHNLQSYNDFEKQSKTFSSEEQCSFLLDAMFGLTAKE